MLSLILSPLHINLLYPDYSLKSVYYYYQPSLHSKTGPKDLAHGLTTIK